MQITELPADNLSLLLRSATQGAEKAFVLSLQPDLLGYFRWNLLSPHDAEDACQEVFVRIFSSLESYDKNRPAGPWLWRIASRVLADCRRDYWRHSVLVSEEYLNNMAAPSVCEGVWDITCLLTLLKREDRKLLEMAYHQDLSIKLISECLGISLAATRKRLERLRKTVRKKILSQNSIADGSILIT
jgi:DNA-directed RNA polymerase specialized sigma24 family protein